MGQVTDMIASSGYVTFVLIPRFNMLTLTTMIEPMRIANYLAPQQLYNWDYRSPKAGVITASNGLQVTCGALEEEGRPQPDIVVVCGSWGTDHYHSPVLFNWLRRRERTGAKLIGVELGVYALARAGLLTGRRATTHWSCKAGFAEAFPNIDVREQLYTIDKKIMTCAGGTAGLDLMLKLVASQHGDQLAAEVANQIIHYPRRRPEDAQKHATGSVDDTVHPDVKAAMSLLEARIEEPLSVPQLCRELGVSQRQLERLFRRSTGCTIVQFSKLLRLQYARVLLTSTDMAIREVSASCGFDSMSYFSLCFMKTFGKKPSRYRQAWPENEPAPSWPGTVYSFIQNSIAAKAKH
ncbi:GlxA family transcriptional regulator [Hypericibacter sp.]|uniref:GlxA family transcriptional regulator n=1 Tax=Hypericibacter sp. TaxID=2705401 RepID=UPI003D6D2B31